METKKSIRQIIRKQRKELDPMIWQSQTAEICRKTCELDVFREATDIYCYIDFGGEVGTRPLMLEAWKLGKTVWVPKVHGETMDFYEITSFDDMYDFDYPMYALTFSSNSRSFFYRKS